MPEFSVPRKITQLPFFPFSFLYKDDEGRDAYRDLLIQRGRLWRGLVDVCHKQYHGLIWTDPPLEKAKKMSELVMSHIAGRIMLDHRSHERENFFLSTSLRGSGGPVESANASFAAMYRRLLRNEPEPQEAGVSRKLKGSLNDMKCYANDNHYKITDEQALLAPARVRGFSLSTKRWAFFLVENISDVVWNEEAFAKLEIDQTKKDYVRALVDSHSSKDVVFDDMIMDKGKGLIMLLHGPPGTGKTLTAESIADFTRKPLYYIGTGELGTSVSVTEPTLKRIFDLAKEWNAILLLDEADCFLSKRTTDDMERNAFVTIFLRLLEYYQGILFLTTNRLEEFDSAFQSRIHFGIEYTELDAARRTRVWKNLLSNRSICSTWEDESFKRLGDDIPINGREIKNLIRTTLAITHRDGKFTEDAIRTVYNLNFKRHFQNNEN